jgi:NAD+ dependent glucose-6-phosphate dehydrogenase
VTGDRDRPLVVITGAAGVIGGILTAGLGDAYRIRRLDRAPEGDPSILRVDLADRAGIERAFEGAVAVVHLGAASMVESPWDEVLESNLVGAYHVFEAAHAAGVPRVVFASSNHVVGMLERAGAPTIHDGGTTIGVDVAMRPDSLYGLSKAFGELLGRYHADAHGMRVVCLRLGTVLPVDDPFGPAPADAAAWTPVPWERRIRATWLSHRDCLALFRCALEADVGFAVAYGVSDVPGRFWDLEAARTELGFVPGDRWPGT